MHVLHIFSTIKICGIPSDRTPGLNQHQTKNSYRLQRQPDPRTKSRTIIEDKGPATSLQSRARGSRDRKNKKNLLNSFAK
ncbi:MAG: hypothetical protein DRH37_00650 [Deltaproteobacteria bacterium]|nr:MAG: hypothetical protein DRH37_00650 [Deltaproteobacteria bacterium]